MVKAGKHERVKSLSDIHRFFHPDSHQAYRPAIERIAEAPTTRFDYHRRAVASGAEAFLLRIVGPAPTATRAPTSASLSSAGG
jgi:hypothetical protein